MTSGTWRACSGLPTLTTTFKGGIVLDIPVATRSLPRYRASDPAPRIRQLIGRRRKLTEAPVLYALLAGLATLAFTFELALTASGDPNAIRAIALDVPIGITAAFAAVLAARGRTREAALLVGGALIGLAVLITLVYRDPAMALAVPVIGFVVTLPHIRGRSLVGFAAVTLAAVVYVSVGSAAAQTASGDYTVIDVVFGGIIIAATLMLFTWRLVRSREQLAEQMTRFVEGVPVGIFKLGADGRIVAVNEAFVRLLGAADRDALIGTLPEDLPVTRPSDEYIATVRTSRVGRVGETEVRRLDGTSVWVRYHVRPEVDADGRIVGFEGAVEDVSADRTAREATARLAAWKQERIEILDALRRLSPGRTVEETAFAICAEIERGRDLAYTALLELHNGSMATVIAARSNGRPLARTRVPKGFGAGLRRRALDGPWVEDVESRRAEPGYGRLASAGLRQLAFVPIEVGGEIVGLLVAGTTSSSLDLGERLTTLGEFAAHSAALLGPVLRRRHVREDLRDRIRDTIERGAFRPVFQSIVDLESGAVLGYEALTRFDDGTPPDRMFADAASCGMGADLETATISAALRASSPLPANRFIDLNVSPEFVLAEEPLRMMLRERGFNIVLEVTEHTPISDYAGLRAAFASLGDNVQVAVDDAGAGYASLRHITELRPQFVKLDRGLIAGIDGDPIRQALITGMVHFTDGVGSMLVAEGVETEAERASLVLLGVRAAQGYLFARPMPAELAPT